MVIATPTRGNRTFQKKAETEQNDMWYSPLPLDVMWGIYARQSTQAQLINNTESTEMQTDDLIKWLVDRGLQGGQWQLFDADLGVSGTLRIDQRTGLQELVERIKAGEIKAVLVYQISRLFRDDTGVEYNVFADICKKHTCVLVTSDGMVFNFSNRMHLKMFRFLAEYAAEYIPQQIGLLHAARMRKARRGLYAGLGSVPRGYVVDYDKASKTYKKFIPYAPHAEAGFSLFERFYTLEGDFATLCREVEAMPFVFPDFDATVDRRNIRDKKWIKVPGGYHISRRGLLWLLTNPVYIGWLIIDGDIISRNNHTAIIKPEHEYLFWYAFERLSPFTTEGEENIERSMRPRRFYQRNTEETVGLLKNRIADEAGDSIYIHLSEGVHTYCRPKKDTKVFKWSDSEIEVDLVDSAFTNRLFSHLRQTHDFDLFRQWIAEVVQKQASLLESITSQLAEIDRQQEAILDEKLHLRAYINQQIKEAVLVDPTANEDELRTRFEEEAKPDVERLRRRSAKLTTMETALQAKLPAEDEDAEVRTARTFADFQTELEKLAEVWCLKPFKEKKEFVNLLVKKAVLSVAATHWIRLDIHWTHPAWENETLFIYRRRGLLVRWTEEDRTLIRELYETADRETLLSLMPHKSWNAMKKEARGLGLRRPAQPALNIDEFTTWSDWQFTKEKGIAPNTRDTICEQLSCPTVTISTSHEDEKGKILSTVDSKYSRFATGVLTCQEEPSMWNLKFLLPIEPEISQNNAAQAIALGATREGLQ